MQSATMASAKKIYQLPAVTKLAPEQAKEFLLHHASMGDLAAKEILKLVLPATEHPK
jgi:hypothetical protein